MELTDKLISTWQPYLAGFAKRTKLPYGYELGDLRQELLIVLCESTRTFTPGKASFKTYLISCVIKRISTLERDSKLRRPKAGVLLPLESGLQVSNNMVQNNSQALDEYGIINQFDRAWLDRRMDRYTWKKISHEMSVPRNDLIRSQRRLRRKIEDERRSYGSS